MGLLLGIQIPTSSESEQKGTRSLSGLMVRLLERGLWDKIGMVIKTEWFKYERQNSSGGCNRG